MTRILFLPLRILDGIVLGHRFSARWLWLASRLLLTSCQAGAFANMLSFIRTLLPFVQMVRLDKIDSHQLVSKYMTSQAGGLEMKTGWENILSFTSRPTRVSLGLGTWRVGGRPSRY